MQSPIKNNCNYCGMRFVSAAELANHQAKFCINSGFDSLNGLVQLENNGKANRNNHNFKKYPNYSLNGIKYQDDVMKAENLEFDLKQMNKFNNKI
jgi:hypothetical protein